MRKLVVCIVVLAVGPCSSAIIVTGQDYTVTQSNFTRKVESNVIWLGSSLLCDILIAGCMSHFLRAARSETAFKATETILTKLFVLTVETGLITVLAASLQLVASLTSSLYFENTWDQFFAFILGKLYSNMLLASLNARAVLVRINNQTGTVKMKSNEGVVFRAEFTGISQAMELRTTSIAVHTGSPVHVNEPDPTLLDFRIYEFDLFLSAHGHGSVIISACLQALYGIPTASASASPNTLGLTGYTGQYANKDNLETFLGRCRTDVPSNTSFALQTLEGGSNPQSATPGFEANLDIQYTVGVATGVPVIFMSVGEEYNDGALEGLLDTANALLSKDTLPQVLTTPTAATRTICPSRLRESCATRTPSSGPVACCPYLTSVGATTSISPESAAGVSSGEFDTNEGRARTSRSSSAGGRQTAQGTSCSSPIFASAIALLNDDLVAACKSPHGFLNPFLYANAAALINVTSGDNPGGRRVSVMAKDECFDPGYQAAGLMVFLPSRAETL
ncbi:hypothetical protein PLICRDRAFT_176797 [Plicaturopsis crispa FD-325 SS-3]|nr:hypothetical protein PLICRDRAFT_176797 [Plicaturopsis crispa FD-325 SS-3]